MRMGLYYAYHPVLTNSTNTWSYLNKAMVLFCVGIGFAYFQDIARPQNKWSKKIFENPKYSRIFTGQTASSSSQESASSWQPTPSSANLHLD